MWLVVKIKSTYITVSLFYFTILIEKFHHLLLSQWWVKLKPSRLIWFSCEWLWCHASTWTLLVVVAGIFHSQFFMFCWRAATFAWVFIRILMHSRGGGKTRNVVECFSQHLRAVAASCVLLQLHRAQSRLPYLLSKGLVNATNSDSLKWSCIS